ncbi:MAG: glycosyltransferase, partial [bacterium]|nr:glycosyltransferase [bacterium]
MKIAVNARLLTRPFTGMGQYTLNLFKELAALDIENEYVLVVPEKVSCDGFSKNVGIKILPEKKFPSAGMRKTWWEQISLPEYFEKIGVDIAFFPYPSNPWTSDWYKKGIKTVVTVHDCIPWKHREYRKGILSKMYHSQTKKAVKMADLVLTVSEESAKDIKKICRAENVEVVYNDAGDEYKKPSDYHILKSLKLDKGRYFVYCG